jgi:hypothetical protein
MIYDRAAVGDKNYLNYEKTLANRPVFIRIVWLTNKTDEKTERQN